MWEPLKAGLKYTYYGVNMVEIRQITIHGKVVTKDLKNSTNLSCFLGKTDRDGKQKWCCNSPLLAAPSSPHILWTRGWIIGEASKFWVVCTDSVW